MPGDLDRTLVFLGITGLTLLAVGWSLAVAGLRRGREQRARTAAAVEALRPRLLDLAASDTPDPETFAALAHLPVPLREAVDDAVLALLAKVRGESAARLVEVLRAHGRIERAHRMLRSARPDRRARAAVELGLMGQSAQAPRIAALLGDRSADVKVAAARALTLLKDPLTAETVLDAVGRRRLPVWVAVEAVAALGPDGAGAAEWGLRHPDHAVRAVAAEVIGTARLRGCAPALREALAAEFHPITTAALVGALGRVGSAGDVDALAACTAADRPALVQRAAVAALGELGHPGAIASLLVLLDTDDAALVDAATAALERCAGPTAGAPTPAQGGPDGGRAATGAHFHDRLAA